MKLQASSKTVLAVLSQSIFSHVAPLVFEIPANNLCINILQKVLLVAVAFCG